MNQPSTHTQVWFRREGRPPDCWKTKTRGLGSSLRRQQRGAVLYGQELRTWTAELHPQRPTVALPLPGGEPGLGLPGGRHELTCARVCLSGAQSLGHRLNRGGAPGGRVREREQDRKQGRKRHQQGVAPLLGKWGEIPWDSVRNHEEYGSHPPPQLRWDVLCRNPHGSKRTQDAQMRGTEQGSFRETSWSARRRPSGWWLCTQCPSSRKTRGQQATGRVGSTQHHG